jgi:hypothetical protein
MRMGRFSGWGLSSGLMRDGIGINRRRSSLRVYEPFSRSNFSGGLLDRSRRRDYLYDLDESPLTGEVTCPDCIDRENIEFE